jgi:hypothetical protein
LRFLDDRLGSAFLGRPDALGYTLVYYYAQQATRTDSAAVVFEHCPERSPAAIEQKRLETLTYVTSRLMSYGLAFSSPVAPPVMAEDYTLRRETAEFLRLSRGGTPWRSPRFA